MEHGGHMYTKNRETQIIQVGYFGALAPLTSYFDILGDVNPPAHCHNLTSI